MGRKKDKQREIEAAKEQRRHDREIKAKLRKKMSKADAFKLSKEYLQYFAAFNKQLSVLRIKLKDVIGDGNCLFRSFADQIDGNQTSHIFMRQEACKYMINHQQFFKPFLDEDEDGTFDQYVKLMKKNGQWGGHLQLQALSECFRCVIVIHKRQMQEFHVRPMTQEPSSLIHLAYFQHEDFEHYASIRDMKDDSQLPAVEGLKHLNNNLYNHLLSEDPEQFLLRKQLEELELIDKFEQKEKQPEDQYEVEEPQPFPNYPKNKKCKCGSKIDYKNCCFKEWQKRKQHCFKN